MVGGGQYKYTERKTPYFSRLVKDEIGISIFQCEFESTITDLICTNWISDHKVLREVDAPFTVLKIDRKSKTVYFASSIYGIIDMYYYYYNGEIIISDSFWDVVNEIDVSFEKLNIEAIREYFAVGMPLFNTTYIKHLYKVNSGMFFQWENNYLTSDKYYSLSISPQERSIEETTKELDSTLDIGIERIYSEMGNVQYSMGLSGGLDSRLIPHYAKKKQMNLSSFILGEPKPRGVFLSRDHINSRKLARIFGIKHEECKWSKAVFYDNVFYNVKNCPLGHDQFFKGRSDINFDVLLTGASGYWVGSSFPKSLQKLNDEELAYQMHKLFRAVSPYSEHLRFLNAALRILVGKEIKSEKKIPWVDEFLDNNTYEHVMCKIKNFIYERRKLQRDNLSIFMDWFDSYGSRNAFGGYESLSGRVRAFSIYNPHVIKTVLHWKYEFFEDRRCLKNLILKYVPETADVKEQKHEGKIGSKPTFLNKLFNGFLFWLLGNGNDIAKYKFKYVEDEFYNRMTNECEWFYKIFNVRDKIDKIMRFEGKDFLGSIWKMKIVMDYMETGEYKKFLDASTLESL